MTTQSPVVPDVEGVEDAVGSLIHFLESGSVPDGLFAPDAFLDFTLPHWRVQAQGADEVVALRIRSHPFPGAVTVKRLDVTAHGFVLEIEERWHAERQDWYCRELLRADLREGRIVDLSVYCTGDWDEQRQRTHAATVSLLRN